MSICILDEENGCCGSATLSSRLLFTERAQQSPNLAVQTRGLLRRGINQLRPTLGIVVELGLTQKIGGLQDGLKRIAEVMRQSAHLSNLIPMMVARCGALKCGSFRFRPFASGICCSCSRLARHYVPDFIVRLGWFDTPRTTCRIEVAVSSIKAAFAAPRSITCRSGGIGRRAWFRSMYPQGCGGSSPFFGTIESVNAGYYALAPWHFLYFLPEPQGQRSLRPIFAPLRTTR